MAVARGGAVVVDHAEGRRVAADTLVAYFLEDAAPGAGARQPPRPAPAPRAQTPAGRDVPGAGQLDRVEAFGNVEIRTRPTSSAATAASIPPPPAWRASSAMSASPAARTRSTGRRHS